MFKNYSELAKLLIENEMTIPQIMVLKELENYNRTEEEIYNNLYTVIEVMFASASSSLNDPYKNRGHIIGGDAYLMNQYAKTENSYCGSFINAAMAMAFSTSEVNAAMGKICAAPTAGSSGILPAALMSAKVKYDLDDQTLADSLLVATSIGELITRNATVSGAEGGCQAECGSAAAMAAGALVFIQGGSTESIFHSASIALKNVMGLICDPIAGLVEAPCAKRNASGIMNAMISADMALAGVTSIIPFDQVVEAMFKVGKALPPSLKETAQGGIAITKKGKMINQSIYGKI